MSNNEQQTNPDNQPVLRQTDCSTALELLLQMQKEVFEVNAAAPKRSYLKESTANDLYALRRVISLIKGRRPMP